MIKNTLLFILTIFVGLASIKYKSTMNKSSNNYLKSIEVSEGALLPEFNKEECTYTIDNINKDTIRITAIAEDEKATVVGTGYKALQNGENTVTLTVKAEDKSIRKYTIKIYRNINEGYKVNNY